MFLSHFGPHTRSGRSLVLHSAAVLLAGAAAAEAWALWRTPGIVLGAWTLPRWLSLIAVGAELALAAWLVSGWRQRLARRIALAVFLAFSGLTAWLTLAGASSCGCFGRLTVRPWLTLVLDTAVVLALWACRDRPGGAAAGARGGRAGAVAGLAATGLGIAGMALVLALAVRGPGSAAGGRDPAFAPGYPAARIDARLADAGRWALVCYRSTCSRCASAMPEWLEWTRLDAEASGRRWAFVSLDDDATPDDLLDRSREWPLVHLRKPEPFAATPQVLAVSGGVVTEVFPSLESFFAAQRQARQR